MSHQIGTARGNSRKFLATGLTALSAVTLACQGAQPKVFATGNTYAWTKLSNQDLMGGAYTSVASSADGSHLIIGSKEGGEGYNQGSPLYVSSDYGATWTNITDNADSGIRDYWTSVDVTDNGQTMIAASTYTIDLDTMNDSGGKIFISHDAGATWQNISPNTGTQWHAAVISGDGSKIAAVSDDDMRHVYISTNGGTSWTTSTTDDLWSWESLSISGNGNKILVGGENSDDTSVVDLSTNGGTSWTNISPDDGNTVFRTRTAISADGGKLAVSTYGYNGDDEYDTVFVSNNNGANWTNATPNDPGLNRWNAIGMSGSGSVLAVEDDDSKMYTSANGGSSWSVEDPGQADSDSNDWRSIDFNTSGSRAITASADHAYVGHNTALDAAAAPTVSLTNPESSKAITLTTPQGTTITCHSPVKESGLSAQDGAYSYPMGLVDFCFSGASASNEVTLTFVTDLKPNQVTVRKFNPTTKQYATVTGADVTETTYGGQHALQVEYAITDNGPLDTDPDNGEIADPVGLAVVSTGAPNTGLAHQNKLPFALAGLTGVGILATLTVTHRRRINGIARSRK